MRYAWLVVLGLVGCVSVQTQLLGPANRFAPVPEDSVRVFLSQEELRDRGYEWEAVALLFGSGSSMYTTDRGMLQTIRRETGTGSFWRTRGSRAARSGG